MNEELESKYNEKLKQLQQTASQEKVVTTIIESEPKPIEQEQKQEQITELQYCQVCSRTVKEWILVQIPAGPAQAQSLFPLLVCPFCGIAHVPRAVLAQIARSRNSRIITPNIKVG